MVTVTVTMATRPLSRSHAAAPRLGPVERWFLPALLALTLALHYGGYHLLHVTRFEGFAPLKDIRQPPRAFQIKQAIN